MPKNGDLLMGKDAPSKISVILSDQSAGNEHDCQHEIAGFFQPLSALPRTNSD